MSQNERHAVSSSEALERLRAGNARFVQNVRSVESFSSQHKRDALVAGQSPYAVVLACSDSRVPCELIFDCGLGDAFVVRVAGNVVAPSILGSIEFAAATFGTELVVVMGHTRCGAVAASVDALTRGKAAPSDNVRDIVERITPGIAELVNMEGGRERLMSAATRANVRASVNQVRRGSRIIESRVAEGRLLVVGAEYSLETGEVEFFDFPHGFELPERPAASTV